MPRETQWSAAVMLDPAAAEEEATSRVWLWEQALEATGGDYSKINYRKSNWAPTLPLGPHNQPARNAGVVKVIALQCSEFVLFPEEEHVFRKAFRRHKYQYRYLYSGIRLARSYNDFIPKAADGEVVRVGLFTEFTNQGTPGTVERHCWAAAYFPETDTHPKTLVHWDARAATRKQESDNKHGDKPYRRTIMSEAHQQLGDLLKPAVELFGGPENGTVNDEQPSSIRWITSVATAPTVDRAFEIAMNLVDPLNR